MSCFDSVYIKCPKCGHLIEFQSKAGDCELEEYYEDLVPIKLACDITDEVRTCPKCQTEVIALQKIPILTIPMVGAVLEEFMKWDKDEDFE